MRIYFLIQRVLQVKKYKTIKDENGNKIQVQKTKEEWNRETKKGTCTWYFNTRYTLNNKRVAFKSKVYSTKREAKDQETIFLNDPISYINNSKHSKKINYTIDNSNNKTLNDYFKDYCNYKIEYVKDSSIYENINSWENHISKSLGKLTPNDINLQFLQSWKNDVNKLVKSNNNPYSIRTKNKWLSVISDFFKYLYQNNY